MEKAANTAQKATGSIRSQAIDLMKLILSVFVVLIHAEVDLALLTPFLRTAVPLFFLTSSYYFFRKIHSLREGERVLPVLGRFLKRNMTLYGFWFLVLLPITLYIRDWFSGSFPEGIVRFLQAFFFNSTFRASWYLMALNIGMCLILLLSRRIRSEWLVLMSLPVYLLCCLFTNYMGLVVSNERIMGWYQGYLRVFSSLCNGFPASLFWIALGNLLAQRELHLSRRVLRGIIILCATGLVWEHLLVSQLGLQQANDAYLMLIPLCCAVFCYVKDTKLEIGTSVRMGHISTVIYASHASVITVVGSVLRRFLSPGLPGINCLIFLCSLLICCCACAMIFALEGKRLMRWLKYAY